MEAVQTVNSPGPETVWAILREVGKKQEELVESQKETDRMLDKVGLEIKALNEQMGGLHNSFGEMAEHLVAPGIVERFNELGFHFNAISSGGFKVLDDNGKIMAQVDILLVNSDYIIAVEVKATVRPKDVEKHVKRLEVLRNYHEKNGDKRIIQGAIAGAIFGDTEKKAVAEAGFYVLVQSGDTMKLELPDGFV
ncbi:MAG: hypothetical protein LBC52_07660, partial [Treponema sp.]|nr:hypothetical protein [Treponema sp.]